MDLFLLHWVLVSCIFPNISLLLLFSSRYWYQVHRKKLWKLLFRYCYQANLLEVFHKTFYQMSGNENLL